MKVKRKDLISYFEQFITPERKKRIEDVLDKRTRYITVVLEDVYQSHNISAVLRSCDCFGINDIHIIENDHKFEYNKEIGVGSFNWLTLIRHNQKQNNTIDAIKKLKKKGYKIIASTPNINGYDLEDYDISNGPVAIFFGTELTGLTNEVVENCDSFIRIPLYGFTESLNISVSAAIILQKLYLKLVQSNIKWHLREKEKEEIKLTWLRNSIRKSEYLEEQFFMRNS